MRHKLYRRYYFDNSQRGAAIPEYVLLLAILLPIFVVIGLALQTQAIRAATESAGAVNNVAPCGERSFLGRDATGATNAAFAEECR